MRNPSEQHGSSCDAQLSVIERLAPDQPHWSSLDVDLTAPSIRYRAAWPLVARGA